MIDNDLPCCYTDRYEPDADNSFHASAMYVSSRTNYWGWPLVLSSHSSDGMLRLWSLSGLWIFCCWFMLPDSWVLKTMSLPCRFAIVEQTGELWKKIKEQVPQGCENKGTRIYCLIMGLKNQVRRKTKRIYREKRIERWNNRVITRKDGVGIRG